MVKNIIYGLMVFGCVSGNTMEGNIAGIGDSGALVSNFFKDKVKEISKARSFCYARIKDVKKNIQEAIEDGYCDGVLADKCQLALKCFDDFESLTAESNLLKTLIKITNNGFYDSSNFYISARFKEDRYVRKEAVLLLDSVWTLLWQMREVLDVTLASTDLNAVNDLLNDRIFVSSFLIDYFDTSSICCQLDGGVAQ